MLKHKKLTNIHIHLLHSTHTHRRMHAAHTHANRHACSMYTSIQVNQQEMVVGLGYDYFETDDRPLKMGCETAV